MFESFYYFILLPFYPPNLQNIKIEGSKKGEEGCVGSDFKSFINKIRI